MTVTIRRDAMQRHDYTEVATSEVAHIGELAENRRPPAGTP